MSLAARIRDFIVQQGRPCTQAECAAGTRAHGDDSKHARKVAFTIGVMYRDGILGREGERGERRYFQLRPVRAPLTAEEARRRRTEYERIRQQTRVYGRRSWAQYLADLADTRRQRETLKAAARIERQAGEKRAVPKPKKATSNPRKANNPKPLPPVAAVAPKPTALRVVPQKPAPRIETVEEFKARGGRVEQLPVGAVSEPLRFIGHAAENEASWRNREQAA